MTEKMAITIVQQEKYFVKGVVEHVRIRHSFLSTEDNVSAGGIIVDLSTVDKSTISLSFSSVKGFGG
jgi:hypothetical protein